MHAGNVFVPRTTRLAPFAGSTSGQNCCLHIKRGLYSRRMILVCRWTRQETKYRKKHTRTSGASPRRADARLGSAYTRNHRGCRRIAAVNSTQQYGHGVHQSHTVFERTETKHGDQIPSTGDKISHPAHDDEQQQEAEALLLQQQQYSNTQSSSSSSTLYAYFNSFLECSKDTTSIIIVHSYTLVAHT